ncbi:hypothetical protein Pla108_37440 [Botrimarina colliarenosi]|uniref:Virginiamycin B lyase n=1 Tax=Botrimarina colliarenosi TaxID=2528001 RepID=A0A5C6A6R4_9BACT|nr:hypothetical protein [Botrimarina colliarenosi]TWT94033.1 hypothetical protein Pla108_37440 [Botrimarina colliarenosi]
MSTPHRARKRLAWAVAFVGMAGGAMAAEPTVALDGLDNPAAIAVREGPRGGIELVVAEAGAGRVTAVVLLGEMRQGAVTLADGVAPAPAALAWSADGSLYVANTAIAAYAVERPALPATQRSVAEAATPLHRFTALAPIGEFVYAIGDGALWRCRRLADRLTEIRRVETSGDFIGLATNRLGYLAALTQGQVGHALLFLDPEKPNAAATDAILVTGLKEPTALAYGAVARPSEPRLYALDHDGVYRLDARVGADGFATATAVQVAEAAAPVAMAFGPDGALYLIEADGSQVLRFAGDF